MRKNYKIYFLFQIVYYLFFSTNSYSQEVDKKISASVKKTIEYCFLAESLGEAENCEKYSSSLKTLSETITDNDKSVNLIIQSKYESEKAKFDADKAQHEAELSEFEKRIKKIDFEYKIDPGYQEIKTKWRDISLYFLIGIDIFFAVLILILIVIIIKSRRNTDITSILKEPGRKGKWSFSRFIGFFGGLFGFTTLIYLFNVSLFHLLYFGTLPLDSEIIIGTIGTFVSTQIPYIIKQLSGQAVSDTE
jgi:hypothetical protein